MKNFIIKLLLLFLIIFSFNSVYIYAEELEETEDVEKIVETKQSNDNNLEVSNKKEESNEEVKVEEPKKEPEASSTETPKEEPEVFSTETPKEESEVSSTETPKEESEASSTETPKEEVEETVTEETNVTKKDKPFNGKNDQQQNQKVKVITKKVDENGNYLVGAKLQIIDSKGKVVDEWVSNGKPRVTYLKEGTYTLHEVRAPKGYKRAADKKIVVKAKMPKVQAGVDFSQTPCNHYDGTPLYYVTIAGVKNEVYCINQDWETPDGNANYSGQILNPSDIRNYTKQTIPVGVTPNITESGVIYSDGPVDISDQTLTDEELYNKLLDIIYHRNKAASVLASQGLQYSEEEIRYITEVALKNYTNKGIAERQYNTQATPELLAQFDAAGVVYETYIKNGRTYVSYIKHNYQDYVYVPDAPLGQSIAVVDYGHGDSFGQMIAGHWDYYHNAKNSQEQRDKVARYYELYKYLISEDDSHPEDMKLYIYFRLLYNIWPIL